MKFSARADHLLADDADTWHVHILAQQRQAAGHDVILLTVGTPDQAPPAAVINATVQALQMHQVGYAPILGLPELRQALARRITMRSGIICEASNIAITPGAQGAAYFAMQALAQDGDEVIVPEPMYAPYPGVVTASGARLIPVRTTADFQLDPAAIAAAITPASRVVWINSPNNPTGAVYPAQVIADLAALCARHGLWLLSDEVYDDLAYDGQPAGAWAQNILPTRVVLGSLSKSHAIPGFRLGWIAGPVPLIDRLQRLLLAGVYGASPFIQRGALAAFNNQPSINNDTDAGTSTAAIYAARARAMVADLANSPGCRPLVPQGGMFVLLDVRESGLTAKAFAEQLLLHQDVAVLPCDGFGASLAGHLRVSLGAPDARLRQAAGRIAAFCTALAAKLPDMPQP